MTTVQQLKTSPMPARPRSTNGSGVASGEMDVDRRSATPITNGVKFGSGPQRGDTRIVVIIYNHNQEQIVSVFAEVLGKQYRLAESFADIKAEVQNLVVGISGAKAKADIATRDTSAFVTINAHCVDVGMPPDDLLSTHSDYEFLYTQMPFFRRDLARFTSFVLGQINHHETLMAKPRTYFISTTFPDVHAALPNIDILTVGADAVELRVDLLKEPLKDGTFSKVPSLSYVGEQLMLLRQRTELPIIYTTRCTRENGLFPMDDPELFYEYLHRAVQWGVEYIDVEIWLPETIRQKLYQQRGSSRIMSAFHDFTSTFKWPSPQAQNVFLESRKYADIVKMIAFSNDHNENFELEYFRSRIRSEYPDAPPLSMVNMGETGQFSRALNKAFTPITHPLLPIIAAPGQMSAAEINAALSLLGQLPKKVIYGISTPSSRVTAPQAPFYEKCFNELGLPHHFTIVERQPKDASSIEAWCNQKAFGGAYLSPPISYSSIMHSSQFFSRLQNGTGPQLTEAARVIGTIDTIVVRSSSSTPQSAPASIPSSPSRHGESGFGGAAHPSAGLPPSAALIFDNASWRGILSTLTRDLAPSAYFGRTALVLAPSSDEGAPIIFALHALQVGKVYTVGFKTPSSLARATDIEPFNSLESLQRARMVGSGASPFVIVSALGPEKSNIVGMLLRVFGDAKGSSSPSNTKRVFLDLADGHRKSDPGIIAEQSGFSTYGFADVTAFTTVEMLRLLVGQNVPYSFVRLASGRGMF
jgi:3-dehydroquinate dehydratase I